MANNIKVARCFHNLLPNGQIHEPLPTGNRVLQVKICGQNGIGSRTAGVMLEISLRTKMPVGLNGVDRPESLSTAGKRTIHFITAVDRILGPYVEWENQ